MFEFELLFEFRHSISNKERLVSSKKIFSCVSLKSKVGTPGNAFASFKRLILNYVWSRLFRSHIPYLSENGKWCCLLSGNWIFQITYSNETTKNWNITESQESERTIR